MTTSDLIRRFKRPGRESREARRARMREVIDRLGREYPESECSLIHRNSYELLVATVLSAQCTDALVNSVTPALFERFPTPEALAAATRAEIEEAIQRVNFYRNKAKSLEGLGKALVERHDSHVPQTMEALVELPGVGRKTANVVLGVGFGKAAGIVVDTHVKRITHRLRFTRESDPGKVEADLLPLVPEADRVVFTHRMIDHGRAICIARRPRCERCVLLDVCPTGLKRTAG